MMCQSSGLAPISIIGFGRSSVSSLMRVPSPPARITAFIAAGSLKVERGFGAGCDQARDGERAGGRGRRRVAYVQRAPGLREDEVVDEGAVAPERLGAGAAEAVGHVFGL